MSSSQWISRKRRKSKSVLDNASLGPSIEEAAEEGDWRAAFQLGCHLDAIDPERAKRFYGLAVDAGQVAAKAGDVDAMYCIADILRWSQPRLSESWYEEAAEAGHSGAISRLALLDEREYMPPQTIRLRVERARALQSLYERGTLTQEANGPEAVELFESAAKGGHVLSMVSLGAIFLKKGDMGGARRWWLDAASRGNVSAMVSLGLATKFGNKEESLRWMREAADRGDVTAMLHLSDLLEASDWEEALRWTSRAAELGNEQAQSNLLRSRRHRWFDKYFVKISWSLREAAVKRGRS